MTASWLRTHPALVATDWAHGWTTREGPDFRGNPALDHAAPVAELMAALELPQAAWVRQVHGGTVLRADGPGCRGEADALWTDRPGLAVVGRGADCPLILVAMDLPGPCWGFAHASWRSTVAGISGHLARTMRSHAGDPAVVTAVICPSAGPCCYEVGNEVRAAALDRLGASAANFFTSRGNRWLFDLWEANRVQLTEAGVEPNVIKVVGECTICGRDYPSYRRDGEAAGRFAAAIGHR